MIRIKLSVNKPPLKPHQGPLGGSAWAVWLGSQRPASHMAPSPASPLHTQLPLPALPSLALPLLALPT